jgi:acetamidase/formamidase
MQLDGSMPADFEILQPGVGDIPGDHYLRSSPETVLWGRLPCETDAAVLSIRSGQSVTIDTVSHEGILEDHGKDPLGYFTGQGVAAEAVLEDAIAIATRLSRDPAVDGPHVVTGPIFVEGAEPGDLLRITVETLVPRVPYGVISNRHGKGALMGELPRGDFHVSVFTPVDERDGRLVGLLPVVDDGERVIAFPLAPFLGTMGVAVSGGERPHSVPPGSHGGNIDINLLVEGSVLYLPVQVAGALAYVGDPHFAQGDGEICGTAIEASLDARIEVWIERDEPITSPVLETATHWFTHGFGADLDEAMRMAALQMLDLMQQKFGLGRDDAYSLASVAMDLGVTQVVDGTLGCHAAIAKSIFV